MKTFLFHVPLSLVLCLAALAPLHAQDTGDKSPVDEAATAATAAALLSQTKAAEEAAARQPPIIEAGDLAVRYLRPGGATARTLADILQRQSKRLFYVRGTDGAVSGPFMNIDSFSDDVIVLHDRKELLPGLEAAVTQLVALAAQPRPDAAPLQVVEYRPRHEAVDNLLRALEPFARKVRNETDSSSSGGPVFVSNVTVVNGAGVLVLRDTPDNIAEMTALLRQIDVAAPQVMLTCLLIQDVRESVAPDAAGGLPDDLVRNLQQLLPVSHLLRVGQAALRVAVVPGHEVTLNGTLGNEEPFQLVLVPSGYDRERGTLSVGTCKFGLNDRTLFSTSTVLSPGDYTVLGASGTFPLFVVLRLSPVGE